MTQAELDALPEDGLFGLEEREIDGVVRRVPVLHSVGVLWQPKEEPMMAIDSSGRRWMLGYGPDGVKYKRRMS